jgi:hypothetical protein
MATLELTPLTLHEPDMPRRTPSAIGQMLSMLWRDKLATRPARST